MREVIPLIFFDLIKQDALHFPGTSMHLRLVAFILPDVGRFWLFKKRKLVF